MILTKDDILAFFSKEYSKEECDQTCPFVEECNKILVATQGKDTLCDVLGASDLSDATIADEDSDDDDDYY